LGPLALEGSSTLKSDETPIWILGLFGCVFDGFKNVFDTQKIYLKKKKVLV
jgi:hypothetical protein